MNTSKSLDEILYNLYEDAWSHGNREVTGKNRKTTKRAKAAIVEAVEGLIIGEDEPLDVAGYNSREVKDAMLCAIISQNQLRASQRKAIKEWQ